MRQPHSVILQFLLTEQPGNCINWMELVLVYILALIRLLELYLRSPR
jgi:hypothetical protein